MGNAIGISNRKRSTDEKNLEGELEISQNIITGTVEIQCKNDETASSSDETIMLDESDNDLGDDDDGVIDSDDLSKRGISPAEAKKNGTGFPSEDINDDAEEKIPELEKETVQDSKILSEENLIINGSDDGKVKEEKINSGAEEIKIPKKQTIICSGILSKKNKVQRDLDDETKVTIPIFGRARRNRPRSETFVISHTALREAAIKRVEKKRQSLMQTDKFIDSKRIKLCW